MEVASVLCVRAGPRACWIPVPTTRRGNLDTVALTSSKSPWAIRALVGANRDRDSCGATLVLKAFESDVRAQVADVAVPDASPPSPKKPRLLDSDSEAEDDSQQSSLSSPCKRVGKAPARRVDKVGFSKIELDGLEVDVGFNKGPGVLFPADAAVVSSVLKFLDQKYEVLLAAGRGLTGVRVAARKDGPHELLVTVPPFERRKGTQPADSTGEHDTNKIRFDFARGAFKILYVAGGEIRRKTKGFEVPRTDALGLVLSGSEYAKVKAAILHKARMAWNQLDESGESRFQEQAASNVAEG